jgi:7,8-dihydro-6-hydroxymethylpterin dimethyltransferase
VCPQCFAERQRSSSEDDVFKDGMLVRRAGSIWMRRFCRHHGESESLYEEDADIWAARNGWQTPTLKVIPDRADNFGSFPLAYQQGLPASHGQHTCTLVLNVTKRCNYACPACYANANAPAAAAPGQELPSIQEVNNTVRTVLAREQGKLGVLMLSGGEPTVRKDLPELIESLLDLNINRIMINTNGRRIARDDEFVAFLARHRRRLEVYLQFDGFRSSTYMALRGEDLVAEKLSALNRLNEAGVFTTLATTVARQINEDEIGDIVVLGLNTPMCAGMAIQPIFGSGRVPVIDPQDRSTPTGILKRLGKQTAGLVSSDDFIPLPCSHKDCCDITYLLKGQDGSWTSIPKLIGKENLKRWISLVGNTISFEMDNVPPPVVQLIQEAIPQRVFSEQLNAGSTDIASDLARICKCIPGLPKQLGADWESAAESSREDSAFSASQAAQLTFRITVKMFMDSHTFHAARIKQCCVHTGTFEKDPRRYSFCWRWLFNDADDFPETVTVS